MAKIRTFIAVNASQRVTNNMARVVDRLAATEAGYRWVEPENLHVTLNYVGDVVNVEIPELCKLIKNSIGGFESFDMSLQGVSGFPNSSEPRVVWIGVDEGKKALNSLYDTLAEVLHHWGVNKDRNEFVPHMTMGRLKRGGRWNEDMVNLVHKLRHHDGGFCHIKEVIVYSSFLDRSGPTYTPMARIKLK